MNEIFHVITTINRGGAENQLLVLVKEQINLGIKVNVVYLKGQPELEEELVNVGARVIDKASHYNFFLQPFILSRLISSPGTVVHGHLPRAELVCLLTPRKFQLVTSRHNAEPFFPGAPRFISNFLANLVERRASRIIAISSAVRDYLLDSGEVRNQMKISLVHYGYRIKNHSRKSLQKKKFPLINLGTISRLAPQKDLGTMILIFRKYKEMVPDASLSILGAGPLQEELKSFAATLGLKDSVIFLGRSSRVNDFLLSLDVFLLTSLYEGFGMVLLEAMDAGIPILAARNSAIPEVLGSDFPGLCETGNPDDFLEKLLNLKSQFEIQRYIEEQENRLKIFSPTEMCQKIAQIYSEASIR